MDRSLYSAEQSTRQKRRTQWLDWSWWQNLCLSRTNEEQLIQHGPSRLSSHLVVNEWEPFFHIVHQQKYREQHVDAALTAQSLHGHVHGRQLERTCCEWWSSPTCHKNEHRPSCPSKAWIEKTVVKNTASLSRPQTDQSALALFMTGLIKQTFTQKYAYYICNIQV